MANVTDEDDKHVDTDEEKGNMAKSIHQVPAAEPCQQMGHEDFSTTSNTKGIAAAKGEGSVAHSMQQVPANETCEQR